MPEEWDVPDALQYIPRLTYLKPEQYQSWLKKVDDPDWTGHRYRDAKDKTMASMIRELREAFSEIERLKGQLTDVRTKTLEEAAKVAEQQTYSGDYYSASTDDMDSGVRRAVNAIRDTLRSLRAKAPDAKPRATLADDCPYCPAKTGETCQRFNYNHPGHPAERVAETE